MKTSLNVKLGVFTLSRLVVNTATRMIYPFLAVFASGLHVDIGTISLAMAVSMATSALGPFLAPIADRRGRKTGMLIGMGFFMTGMLAASLFPSIVAFFIAIILGSLGNNVLLPPIQAYLGDHTPYERRGFYMAVIELSWALSFILMVPLAGLILEKTLWNGPFIALAVTGGIATLLIWWLVPNDLPAKGEPVAVFADIRKVLKFLPAVMGMLMGLSFIIGNEMITIVFGVWMQDAYGLQIAALGAASAVIGFSELSGEGIAAFLADRIGKERSIASGIIVSSLTVITLPLLGKSMVGAFIWLFLFYMSFEVVIISALPLMSEIMPKTRATMMALFIAALSIGRALGDVAAPQLYKGGILVNAGGSLIFNLLALFLLTRIKFKHPKKVQPVS
jgi:predicted MFS family arabinose efflux permease